MNQLPTLYLLPSVQLTAVSVALSNTQFPHIAAVLKRWGQIESMVCDDLAAAIYEALKILPLAMEMESGQVVDHIQIPNERYEEHDTFFGVIRVTGNPVSIWVRSILQAYASFMEGVTCRGSCLNRAERQQLRFAFDTILNFAFQQVSAQLQGHILLEDKENDNLEESMKICTDPIRRWRVGHHIFLILIQGLIILLDRFRQAIEKENVSDAHFLLHMATVLMKGSAVALKFAGDFEAADYDQIVRPTMMPPHLESGFSGFQAKDHQYLIKSLKELKPIFRQLPPALTLPHQQFVGAMKTAYDAHKYVCARFKGNEVPSLRMNQNKKISATGVLENLGRNRLSLINGERTRHFEHK